MNKYLLGTTALVAASLIAGMASAAEPLKVGVSGNMKQWFGVTSQTTDGNSSNTQASTTGGRDYANTGLVSDTEIDFTAKTTLDNGLEVTARVDLDIVDRGTGANNGAPSNAVGLDEEWASIGSAKYGKVYAGVKESINGSMHNEAVDVGIGYGDVDQWIHEPAGMLSFGSGAAGGNNNWDNTSMVALIDDSASVSYVSPKFYGVQFGATFAPNGQGNTGGATTIGPANRAYHQSDAWDTSLAYSGAYKGVTIGADAGVGGSQGAKALQTGVTSTANVWNTGVKLGYAGFTFGAGLFNYNDDLELNSGAANLSLDGHSWNVGLSYANGPWAASLLYYNEQHAGSNTTGSGAGGNAGADVFETYLLSGKYALGPGIDAKASAFYAEYNGRNYNAANVNYDSKGTGLVTGLDLTF